MRLIIIGLRRSGTTIFWESFRRDERLVCYDEPFNRLLEELPAPERKGTRDEWISLYRRNPARFRELFSPILRSQELTDELSAGQRAYLSFVLASAEHIVVDTTRCHFKLAALSELAPHARVVHLYRRAAAWVSSHLAPRRSGWVGGTRATIERRTFFSRRRCYNNWGLEEIIGQNSSSAFGKRLAEAGLEPSRIYALPAVGRLLAYWKIHHDRVEQDAKRLFLDGFVSVALEDFCESPRTVISNVYARMGMDPPDLDLRGVHPAHGAYLPGDPRWARYGAEVGVSLQSGLLV